MSLRSLLYSKEKNNNDNKFSSEDACRQLNPIRKALIDSILKIKFSVSCKENVPKILKRPIVVCMKIIESCSNDRYLMFESHSNDKSRSWKDLQIKDVEWMPELQRAPDECVFIMDGNEILEKSTATFHSVVSAVTGCKETDDITNVIKVGPHDYTLELFTKEYCCTKPICFSKKDLKSTLKNVKLVDVINVMQRSHGSYSDSGPFSLQTEISSEIIYSFLIRRPPPPPKKVIVEFYIDNPIGEDILKHIPNKWNEIKPYVQKLNMESFHEYHAPYIKKFSISPDTFIEGVFSTTMAVPLEAPWYYLHNLGKFDLFSWSGIETDFSMMLHMTYNFVMLLRVTQLYIAVCRKNEEELIMTDCIKIKNTKCRNLPLQQKHSRPRRNTKKKSKNVNLPHVGDSKRESEDIKKLKISTVVKDNEFEECENHCLKEGCRNIADTIHQCGDDMASMLCSKCWKEYKRSFNIKDCECQSQ